MPRTLLIAFVALLIIIPVTFFAYKFLVEKGSLVETTTPSQDTTQTIPQEVSSRLTADESFVLSNILESKETEKEKNVFQIALSKAAIESEQLDITSCFPTPVVFNLKTKKDFTVTNNDQVAHTLTIYASKYQIPAKGNTTIVTADFAESGHVYPYSCDDISVAGVIWLPK